MSRRRDADGAGVGVTLALVGAAAVGGFLWWSRRRKSDEAPLYNASDPSGAPAYYAADDVEALGRVITSEANRYSLVERKAIAWTVRNRAKKRSVSIVRLVCSPCGPQGPGRPFASSRSATVENLRLARDVLAAPESDDPTRGALAFYEPGVQDKLVNENRRLIAAGQPPKYPGYRLDSAEVRAKWIREGQQPKGTVGAFEFFA